MARRPSAAAAVLAVLPGLACIEDRLTVEIATHVHPDGSCTRRVEYRLERLDTDKGGAPLSIPPGDDPLRLFHRFPAGEAWVVRDEPGELVHTVLVEATLASPNEIDWDYWSQAGPRALPVRNHVSFSRSGEGRDGVYEYLETFVDPGSPLAGMRQLARLLVKRDDDYAKLIETALGNLAPRRSEIRRAWNERLALPFSREVEAIAARPDYGPRERREIEELNQRLNALHKELARVLVELSPVAAPVRVEESLDGAFGSIAEALERELERSGVPSPIGASEQVRKVRYRATLVLPGTILRANTCAQGDTASWEFEDEDLYGRGFQMWARAVARP